MLNRPEKELLLCCARSTVGAASAAQIGVLLRNDIDWAALIKTALRHGVMPLLYRNLTTTCPDMVPKFFLNQLRAAFYANAGHNAFFTRELLKLLRILETHGVPALPFKGPVLAASVYGSPALRQFGDLDILIREKDAERARDLLLANGYRCMSQVSAVHTKAFHRARKVYELVCHDERVVVELHWAFTSWTFFFPLDTASLWERLETGSLEDRPVRTLAAEDLLLLLCVHGAKHYWSKLGWICDVAELLRIHPGLKWTVLLLQANELGGRRMLFLGLLLAHVLLDAELPEDVWKKVNADPAVRWLAAKVQTQLFAGRHGHTSAVNDPAFYLKLRERVRERMACGLYLTYLKLPADTKTALLLLTHGDLARLKCLCAVFRKTLF